MSNYVIDSFDMPHNVGATAKVIRLDQVTLRKNLFGKYDAFIYMDDSDNPSEILPSIRIGIANSEVREKLGLEDWAPGYPNMDDVVLFCEYSGGTLYWYKVTYAYNDATDK